MVIVLQQAYVYCTAGTIVPSMDRSPFESPYLLFFSGPPGYVISLILNSPSIFDQTNGDQPFFELGIWENQRRGGVVLTPPRQQDSARPAGPTLRKVRPVRILTYGIAHALAWVHLRGLRPPEYGDGPAKTQASAPYASPPGNAFLRGPGASLRFEHRRTSRISHTDMTHAGVGTSNLTGWEFHGPGVRTGAIAIAPFAMRHSPGRASITNIFMCM